MQYFLFLCVTGFGFVYVYNVFKVSHMKCRFSENLRGLFLSLLWRKRMQTREEAQLGTPSALLFFFLLDNVRACQTRITPIGHDQLWRRGFPDHVHRQTTSLKMTLPYFTNHRILAWLCTVSADFKNAYRKQDNIGEKCVKICFRHAMLLTSQRKRMHRFLQESGSRNSKD